MDDREVIRGLETVSNRKAMLVIGLVAAALAAVIGLVVAGFRGEDVSQGADAVTESVTKSPRR